jgi:hypothetical protein
MPATINDATNAVLWGTAQGAVQLTYCTAGGLFCTACKGIMQSTTRNRQGHRFILLNSKSHVSDLD